MAHVVTVDRAAGRSYVVRWRDGERFRQKTFSVKREAERHALAVETTKAQGQSTDLLVRSSKTVAQVVEASLAAGRPELKPRTYLSYRRIYDNRILPRFGSRKVGTVTRAEVQAWIIELAGEGLAPATIHHHYVALKKAMRFALHDRIIAFSPCDGIKLPKAKTVDAFAPVFLTGQQAEALAEQLDRQHPYGLLVRFAAYTGLRAGEVAGLRVRDVNLKAAQIEVRRTLQHMSGEWVAGTPKSARSTRNVPLVNRALIADLRAYLMQHPNSGDPDALLWPGRAVGGTHRADWTRVFDVASFRRNYLRPALAAAGLPEMRFHDLRHTFASLMLAAGFPPYEVSRWLGHANLATTDSIYAHLYPSDYSAHQDRFEAFVAGGAPREGGAQPPTTLSTVADMV